MKDSRRQQVQVQRVDIRPRRAPAARVPLTPPGVLVYRVEAVADLDDLAAALAGLSPADRLPDPPPALACGLVPGPAGCPQHFDADHPTCKACMRRLFQPF